MSFDPRMFRQALGCFPTGVTVITTLQDDGSPVGVTISSFTSVSLDPPLVLFCLDNDNPYQGSFRAAGRFAVNVLTHGQEHLSVAFGSSKGSQWQGVAYRQGGGGMPVLAGCLVNLECVTVGDYEGGDHRILVGHVEHIHLSPDGQPLVHCRGLYGTLAAD